MVPLWRAAPPSGKASGGSCFLLACWLLAGVAYAENWPQWRGPQGTGVSGERDVPLHWNDHRSIVWKVELPGWGTSTPAIWNDAVLVTSQSEDGRLWLTALHRRDGRTVWQREIGQGVATREAPKRSKQKFHQLHNLASPSPVTNGEVVVAHFGNGDLAAFDFMGRQLWKRNLQEDHGEYTIWWGHANSPVIVDDMVISVCMQDSLSDLQPQPAESYLVAHDLLTGRQRWKTPRMTSAKAEECDAYTTPLLIEFDDQRQLVVMGGNELDAYDPGTGKQLWKVPGLVGGRTVTGPIFHQDRIVTTQGMRGPLVSVRIAPRESSYENPIAWSYDQGTPDTCSPVAWRDWIFTVNDDGIARCFEADSGRLLWKERLRGTYKASPVAMNGRIFFLNTEGLCTIVAASARFQKVAENQLEDETIASPAVSQDQMFLRGRRYLWCIGRL